MRVLLFIAILLLPVSSMAGKLDVDYYQPSPTKTFMWSAVVPGGGFFYLDYQLPNARRKYFGKGIFFLLAEGAALGLMADQARKGKNILPFLAGFVGLKVFEFDAAIEEAETMRHNHIIVSGN